MITLLVGHRGVGKTTFLRGLAKFDPQLDCRDLDEEIEKASGSSVAELLAKGESEFRDLERQVLAQTISHTNRSLVIAIGAGFEGPIPQGVHVVWLCRVTDRAGRTFLGRPRLDSRLSPMDEYRERFLIRERRFADWAFERLILPEGYSEGLEEFFLKGNWRIPFDLTLLPEDFRAWGAFLEKRKHWHIRRFEIRDDLLSPAQIDMALKTLPHEKILFSRRIPEGQTPQGLTVDWPLEAGEPPPQAHVISIHEREDDFISTLTKLAAHKGILKLAVEVKDFVELKQGHEWWLKDPSRRSFLPRSERGRWRWYRSLFGPRMPLNFFREGEGSSLDQPPLWQVLLQPAMMTDFAAVIGQPVDHSRSPMEHLDYFRQKNIPFVSIEIHEEEFTFALQLLCELGLRYAAVTAPLKKLAWAEAQVLSKTARQMQSANSLFIDGGKITAHNTDVVALQEIRNAGREYKNVWLWGGGGIKTSVKAAWPQAREISARQGSESLELPDLVIWATSRGRRFAWPAPHLRPQLILDLNYGDDSPGLEWAVQKNLPYQSGLGMFKLQAAAQRGFWSACDNGEWP